MPNNETIYIKNPSTKTNEQLIQAMKVLLELLDGTQGDITEEERDDYASVLHDFISETGKRLSVL